MPGYSSSAVFTPAASAHAANSVVGGVKEFKGLSGATGSSLQIASAGLMAATATLETSTWRVYLYNVTPPSALADAAAWDLVNAGDIAAFLGYVDIAQLVDLGSTLYIQSDNLNKQIKLSGRTVFGYLVTITGLTPAAVAHTVTLHSWVLP